MGHHRARRALDRAGHRRSITRVLAVACLAVLLQACGNGGVGAAGSEAEAANRTLRLATLDPTCTVDPSAPKGFATASYGFAELLMRPTLDGGVEPWLLADYTQATPLEWRFTLREGIRFHNGRAVDAAAVVAALQTRAAEQFSPDPVSTGELAVTGPLTFTLTTPAPNATVPNALALIYSYPIYDTVAAEQAGTDENALVEAGIFTGPYRPASIDPQRIEAPRFDGYWGPRPALDSVEVLCIPDGQARVAAVRSGEADVALVPPSDAIATLRGASNAFYVRSDLANSGLVLHLNLTRPPFDEADVRRALALAIDYEALAAQSANGRFDAALGLYPTAFSWAAQTQMTDQAEANRLLDAAGWVKGPDGIRSKNGNALRILYVWSPNADADHEAFGVVLRSQLQPFGFDVAIQEVESSYSSDSFPPGWTAAAIARNTEGLGNNPAEFIGQDFGSQGSLNSGGINDPKIDDLVEQLEMATDPTARDDLLRQFQAIAAEQRYVLVLGFAPYDAVVNETWRDFAPDPRGLFVFPETGPGG